MSAPPETWKRVQVGTMCTDSHKALVIAESAAQAPGKDEVTLKIQYAGVNATDINAFMGAYGGGAVPFDCGLEALGTVVAAGESASEKHKVGDVVLIKGLGCWAEYKNFNASQVLITVPSADPKWLTLPISVLTAAISVGEQSEAKAGDVAVVTAAAGGFGQFTVQFLKQRGCTVVGTCSSAEKGEFLKSLGVDRVVDYKKENLGEVLKKEYPSGVNIVYESVGGDIYEQCLANLAIFGRFIVIGSVTGYKEQKAFQDAPGVAVPLTMLRKSAAMKGFYLPHWSGLAPGYIKDLLPKMESGELKCQIDQVKTFGGLGQLADAVEHLHAGKSFGKVVVRIQE